MRVESIVTNGDLIKKVAIPKLVFPMAALVSNIINLLLSLIPLAILVPLLRHPFYWTWLYLPVPLLALTIFTMGMTFFFAAANVLLPGRVPHSAGRAVGLVLCHADHLSLDAFRRSISGF